MFKSKYTLLTLFLFTAVLLFSCGPKNETIVTVTLNAVGSGPFFTGPNSLISEYEVNLNELEGLEGVTKEQIAEVTLKSVKVMLDEASGMDFSAFSGASLQMVSAAAPMQTVAVNNKIESADGTLPLEAVKEKDLVEYFTSDKFSVVLDLDFTEDVYEDEIGSKIVMELNVKY